LQILLSLGGILCGMLLSVQAGVNAQLSRMLGQPILAATASFAVGLLTLICLDFVFRLSPPSFASLRTIPFYQWLGGGFLGALYLSGNISLAPRLGVGSLMALLVAGQLITAMTLDHFALLGFPQHSFSLPRALGAAFLIAGAVLVSRF
jgi:transporter family-2 protein